MLILVQEGLRDEESGVADGYVFDICEKGRRRRSVGYVSLRLFESPGLYYLGHIGYRVDAPYRGRGYAAKAVRLLMPLMAQRGLRTAVITTNEDNAASRKTCERLGCVLESIVPVPEAYRGMCMGARAKCRYILRVTGEEADAD